MTERRYIAHGLLVLDGRALLLRRLPGKYAGGLWDVPGGTVEPGETPDVACLREFSEETALRVRLVRELNRLTNMDTGGRDIEFVTVTYVVALEDGVDPAAVMLRSDEHDAFVWVPLAEIAGRSDVVWHVPPAIEAWERGA